MASPRNNPFRNHLGFALVPAVLILAGLIPLSCNLADENGRTFIHVETDSAWTRYDSLEITWKDTVTGAQGILYQGPPAGLDPMNKLPADDYKGQKIDIVVKGIKGGELVYQEVRHFDGQDANAMVIDTVVGKTIPVGPKTDTTGKPIRKPGLPTIAMISQDRVISIHDSVSFSAAASAESTALKSYAWDYDGDGVFGASVPVSGTSILIVGGHRYGKPDDYSATLKVVAEGDSVAVSTVQVKVVQDLPVAQAGKDTTIYVKDTLRVHGVAQDMLGKIIRTEWKIGRGEFTPFPGDSAGVPSDTAGDVACIFRVTDDDSQSVSDTVFIHIVSSTESVLTGISVSKGALSPPFSPDILSYVDSVAFPDSMLSILPTGLGTLTVDGDTLKAGQGPYPLKVAVGTRKVAITVRIGGKPPRTYEVAIIRAPAPVESNDATLSGLELSAGSLQPGFTPGVTSYALAVGNSHAFTRVTATVANPSSTLKIDNHAVPSGTHDSISLPVGVKTITVEVTAPNAEKKSYTIKITRAANGNADLSSLSVSPGSLDSAFKTSDTLYSVAVGNAITGISLTPMPSAPTSQVKVDGKTVPGGVASAPIPLAVGANQIPVVVTAEDQTTRTYLVTVTRAKNANTDLSGLTLSPSLGDLVYTEATSTYSLSVANSVASAGVIPTVSATSSVTVSGVPATPAAPKVTVDLKVGLNAIPIVVTAENGDKKTYTLAITKAANADATLAGLVVSAGALVPAIFSPAILEYTMNVDFGASTTLVVPKTAASTSTLKVNGIAGVSDSASGPFVLKVGETRLQVEVTAENGAQKTYVVKITRKNGVSAIAAGREHCLAVLGTGTVVAWGRNDGGQSNVPLSLTDAVSVAGGGLHSLAVKADGTVVPWGWNYDGQATLPPGLADVKAVTAGDFHSVALRKDGTVAAWGNNEFGTTSVPAGLSGVIAISNGGYHSLALKSDGTVVAWGSHLPVPVGLSDVVAIAAGGSFNMALKSSGALETWGSNTYGQCTIPPGLTGVKAIAAGNRHAVALKSDGTVVAWGDNSKGQSTVPASLSGVVAISTGMMHTMVLKSDGTVLVWGDGTYGKTTVPPGLK